MGRVFNEGTHIMNKSIKELFSLDGKTALVTGACGILGQRFCHGLAEMGANIAVVDLSAETSQEFAEELTRAYSIKAVGVACNVSSPEQVKNMLRVVLDTLGEVHILHNNAAGKSEDLEAFFAPFEEYTLHEWQKIMSVNLDGMFLVAQAVGKQMIAQGKGGSIIQTASIYGIMAPDQRIYEGSFYLNRRINTPAVYSASKAGVVGLSKYLATYWAGQEIRVNTLTPGGVESGQNATFKEKYSARIPMGRMAQQDEMIGALIYLASDASSYVTGQNVIVDGGLDAW